MPLGIRENRAEQTYRTARRPLAAAHVRKATILRSLRSAGRFARRDVMHECVDILACHGSDLVPPEKRLYVPLNAPAVSGQRARLLGGLTLRQQPPGFGIL